MIRRNPEKSVFFRGLAAFSAHLHALGNQLKFRATQIPGPEIRGKTVSQGYSPDAAARQPQSAGIGQAAARHWAGPNA